MNLKAIVSAILLATFLTACARPASLRSQPTSTVVDVTRLGVIGDGTTLNTVPLQGAIDDLSGRGGGTLTFPAGRYLTGTLQIKDNITLQLQKDSVLLGSTNSADYKNLDPFIAGDGVALGYAFIVAMDAHHVGIEGAGTIDGQGKQIAAAQKPYKIRPFLIRWIRCVDVSLTSVTLQNPGAWTNHFFQCHNVTVADVTIRSYTTGLANNDGIDIDSCDTVSIRRCDIESGDDSLCIKATSALPSQNISIENCSLHTRCNSIKLGTESLGDFQHIHISHCQIHDVGMSGVALYSVDGSHLGDVSVMDCTMDGVNLPISIRLGARLKTFRAGDTPKPPGTLSDITLKNIAATHVKSIGLLINGIPDHPVDSLHLENISIQLPGGADASAAAIQFPEKEATYPEWNMFGRTFPAYGVYLRHARNVTATNIYLTPEKPDARPAAILIDTGDLTRDQLLTSP